MFSSLIASAPDLCPVNFNPPLKDVLPNRSVNLTVSVISELSLTNHPKWLKINDDLPEDSHTNYTDDDYFSLFIDKASYDDRGIYCLTASNQCGTSTISVTLRILKGNDHCAFNNK